MAEKSPGSRADVAATLGLEQSGGGRKGRWLWLAAAVVLAALVAIGAVVLSGPADEVRFQTAKVERANLTVIVTATGTLQPTNQVDIGSELSGIIKTVEVDFNDRVKVGQVLARLDATKLQAQVVQSEAALKAAQARVREAEANEDETRRRLKRAQELSARNFVSEEALVTAEAAHKRAVAALESARSQVEQNRATLAVDRTNLGKAAIRSPINGTVLTRKAEPGQTVAATLQAPVLFTLAEDLTKMELHVDVDEADVGQVKDGQQATFAVDAHPNREFPSTVSEVRNAAKTVSGVVTYETVLAVENADLLLRPGMTGTAGITVNELRDAVLVPNAALRFTPPPPQAQSQRSFVSRLLPGPPRPPARSAQKATDRRHQQVWTLRDGRPVAIPVTVGATDGRMTQIITGDVQPGLEILTDTLRGAK
ncbi:MAG: efflux RND transporter periplasmic adaptor subunit [Betaproteobacteria bacterium]|nr:efflux RND transporter periplasmic adaptor subunit [Betaproteobacteria bacterium]